MPDHLCTNICLLCFKPEKKINIVLIIWKKVLKSCWAKSRLFDKLPSLNEEKINDKLLLIPHTESSPMYKKWLTCFFFNLGWFESAHNILVLKDSCFYLSPQQVTLTYVMVRKITVHGLKNELKKHHTIESCVMENINNNIVQAVYPLGGLDFKSLKLLYWLRRLIQVLVVFIGFVM